MIRSCISMFNIYSWHRYNLKLPFEDLNCEGKLLIHQSWDQIRICGLDNLTHKKYTDNDVRPA